MQTNAQKKMPFINSGEGLPVVNFNGLCMVAVKYLSPKESKNAKGKRPFLGNALNLKRGFQPFTGHSPLVKAMASTDILADS